MLTNITFGKYYARDSVVHKLNPLFKIISLIIMIVAIFFISTPLNSFTYYITN